MGAARPPGGTAQARPPLYLASASPRRRDILDQLGIPHAVLAVPAPPGDDEPQWPGEPAADYVRRTALEKVERAVAWLDGRERPADLVPSGQALVLGADTTVILDGEVLGKPRDAADASRILGRLSGRRHQVHTAVAIAAGGRLLEALSISEVEFAPLDDAAIAAYCASGEAMGKAGAYAIQGRAGAFVRHLSGSYTGVMGLPAFETAALLAQADLAFARQG